MDDQKRDPIGDEFFAPLVQAEAWAERVFYVGALVSFLTLLVEKQTAPLLYNAVHAGFVLLVIASFVLSLAIRLYFAPRAQIARYKDFLAHAYGKPTSHQQTERYYNNAAPTPHLKVAAQVLESAFFSKRILEKMAPQERCKIAGYALVLTGLMLWRHAELNLIAVAAQAVFCEQIAARYYRFERLKSECERVYDDVYTLLQSKRMVDVLAQEAATRYEIWKAVASVPTSPTIFRTYNEKLNEEWTAIRTSLKI